MAGPTLKKVQRGQPLAIPAETFNTFIDAAQDYKSRQHRREPSRTTGTLHPDVVLVKNVSGADRQRFDILGIEGLLITPADNLPAFQNQPVFTGTTPTITDHHGRFVILLEPLAAGRIGSALLTGVVPVRLRIIQETDTCADVDDDSPTRLKSAASGAAQILWTEPSESEERWGLVRLGPFVRQPFFARLTDRNGENLSPAFSWTEVELVLTQDGPRWHDKPYGRSGDWNGDHPAYEINNLRATLDEDLHVLMWQERDGRYYFDSAHTGFGNEQPDDRKVYQPLSDPHVDPPFLWEINAQPQQADDPTRAHHGVVVLLKVKDPTLEGEEGELWIDAHFDTLGHLVRLDYPPDTSSSAYSGDSSSQSSSQHSSSVSSQSVSSDSAGTSSSGSQASSSLDSSETSSAGGSSSTSSGNSEESSSASGAHSSSAGSSDSGSTLSGSSLSSGSGSGSSATSSVDSSQGSSEASSGGSSGGSSAVSSVGSSAGSASAEDSSSHSGGDSSSGSASGSSGSDFGSSTSGSDSPSGSSASGSDSGSESGPTSSDDGDSGSDSGSASGSEGGSGSSSGSSSASASSTSSASSSGSSSGSTESEGSSPSTSQGDSSSAGSGSGSTSSAPGDDTPICCPGLTIGDLTATFHSPTETPCFLDGVSLKNGQSTDVICNGQPITITCTLEYDGGMIQVTLRGFPEGCEDGFGVSCNPQQCSPFIASDGGHIDCCNGCGSITVTVTE